MKDFNVSVIDEIIEPGANVTGIVTWNHIFQYLADFDNINGIREKLIKAAKTVEEHADVSGAQDNWAGMILDCVYLLDVDEELAETLLSHVFFVKSADWGVVPELSIQVDSMYYSCNPVQMLIPHFDKPSHFLQRIFSSDKLPTERYMMVEQDTKVFNTLAYDPHFNRVIDEIVARVAPGIENFKIGKAEMIPRAEFFMALSKYSDAEDWVQYVKGKPKKSDDDVRKAFRFIFDFLWSAPEREKEPLEKEEENEDDICSISMVCVDHGNIAALNCLIASGKDPKFLNRSMKFVDEEKGYPFARNSLEHCFVLIEKHLSENRLIEARKIMSMKNIIRLHLFDQEKSIQRARKAVGWFVEALSFAMVVCICDNIFEINGNDNAARFFRIACRLPLEVQMILVNRAHGISADIIRSSRTEQALKILF